MKALLILSGLALCCMGEVNAGVNCYEQERLCVAEANRWDAPMATLDRCSDQGWSRTNCKRTLVCNNFSADQASLKACQDNYSGSNPGLNACAAAGKACRGDK
jgi:hypothetical protein